jgi:hypothetical protein
MNIFDKINIKYFHYVRQALGLFAFLVVQTNDSMRMYEKVIIIPAIFLYFILGDGHLRAFNKSHQGDDRDRFIWYVITVGICLTLYFFFFIFFFINSQ